MHLSHKWIYSVDGESRKCEICGKYQEWVVEDYVTVQQYKCDYCKDVRRVVEDGEIIPCPVCQGRKI